ncbi:hypothetical protein Tco_0994229 [Tanacetum coccineum]
MTRSSTSELFTPYKESEREFRSSRRHFKTLSLDELRSPDFNSFSDQEYSEEEVVETMAETMEQYMSKTRADYGSGVARPKIEDKDNFELKGQFLKELRTNTFSGSDHEDANEHIEKVLEIIILIRASRLKKILHEVTAELISKEYMETALTESNLSNVSNTLNIELSKEFLTELQDNAYHRIHHEDVVDHIAMVLELLDLINIPGVDSHQLRMKIFPLSLADDARQWWINEGEGKITTWEELVEKFFCKFYPESYDGEEEMLDEGNNWGIVPLEFISRVNSSFGNHKRVDGRTKKVLFHSWLNGSWNKRHMNDDILSSDDTTTESLLKPYLKTQEKDNTKKEDVQGQLKRKSDSENLEANNTSNTINDERHNKRMCDAERFEAIKYSLGPNEEYIAIRRCEYNA